MPYALVIDDNKLTADALVQILKLWDLPTREALSPATAMAILRTDTPRVIFLDINMPGVDGFEVLAFLKREPRLMNVPVIVVTSDDQPETTRKALNGGASAVVIKPAMPDLIEAALKNAGII